MTRQAPSPVDPIAGPLQALRHAVEALRPHLASADQKADLFLIEEATSRLARPRPSDATGIAEFDPSRLAQLLRITGPELGPELLARLTEDLASTQAKLATGARSADWTLLREGSHVLISLAGSVGALSLQAMAESLNALAHRQDAHGLPALMAPLDAELAALIRLIRATKAPDRPAR